VRAQAFLPAEKYTISLYAGVVVDNGLQIGIKGRFYFFKGAAGEGLRGFK
jgi:hypothetical protein